MGGWRYLAQRLDGTGDGGELLDVELPLLDVAFTDVLSGPTQLSATIDPAFTRLRDANGPILTEWGTAIFAEEDGNIIGGGILDTSNFAGPKWSLDCVGYCGYPYDMPYTDSWFGVEIDPLEVVREIWSHLQDQDGGNLGLQVDSTTLTGKKIGTELQQGEFDTVNGPLSFESGPIKLNWWQTHDLGGEIDTLAKATPFDYHERHQWEGDTIKHYLDFFVPRAGRRLDLRFVIGENVHVIPTVTRTGSDYASEILALGAGEGRTMKMAQAKRNTGRLRRVAIAENKAARSLRAIQAVADTNIAWRSNLDTISELVLVDHPNAPMGSVKPGDELLLEGKLDWVDISTWVRVLSTTVRPASGNAMTLTVAMTDRV
jgi:hypothetical protein